MGKTFREKRRNIVGKKGINLENKIEKSKQQKKTKLEQNLAPHFIQYRLQSGVGK